MSDQARPMATAPKDGTHILAYLWSAPDDCGYRGFGEWREIWWKPYTGLGMFMPWHAGDLFDSHTAGEAPEHFGEGVPIGWLPLPKRPIASTRSGRCRNGTERSANSTSQGGENPGTSFHGCSGWRA